jgi:enamine deaminase RidA (YjgF/YER057c/UK114 family)
MPRTVLTPPRDGKPIGMYSAGFVAQPAGLVFVAGQVAMDAEGRVVGEGDFAAQATQVYRNLAGVLAEAGCALRDVVKFTTFLVRSEDWAAFAEWRKAEYPRLFPDGVYPANTGVVVRELARPQLLLEIEAVAVRPGRPRRPARRRAGGPAAARRRGAGVRRTGKARRH